MVKGFAQLAGVMGLMALSSFAWAQAAKVANASPAAGGPVSPHGPSLAGNWKMLESYCVECHNTTDWAGTIAFDTMTPEGAADDAEVWEKAVRKMRGSLMPPPGKKQPDEA
ncbi:MAG TPA: c-type cytochrome domain-containing protein, partial [Steroidobacteraceae bacterium]|nr:c-type cytochrome domain-containing protein [Steroidobacteraceae bacterium]